VKGRILMAKRVFILILSCLLAFPAALASGETVSLVPVTPVAGDAALKAGRTSVGEAAMADPLTVTYLDFGTGYTDLNVIIKTLEKYPNLKKVDMFGTPVWRGHIEDLTSRFPGIEFGWTIRFGDGHSVRTDATAFSTLHFSDSTVHYTKDLSLLRYCKKLKALDFGHNAVDDISWLRDLPDLRVLIIAINRIKDISPLADLKNLEYLEIFNNYITDLSPLAGLTHLMDLNLSYNLVEDYSPLYGMTSLKRLWLYNSVDRRRTEVPPSVIETLREKLPDCQLDYTSEPTLGGWREHPHYDVIHAMFATPDYQPFEDSWPVEAAD